MRVDKKFKFIFEELHVWQASMSFAEGIYKETETYPEEEKYGIVSQLRRSSISIASNIAEGKGRYSKKEFKHFLFVARGSFYEALSLMTLSLRLNYLSQEKYQKLIDEAQGIQRKLSGLINSLN